MINDIYTYIYIYIYIFFHKYIYIYVYIYIYLFKNGTTTRRDAAEGKKGKVNSLREGTPQQKGYGKGKRKGKRKKNERDYFSLCPTLSFSLSLFSRAPLPHMSGQQCPPLALLAPSGPTIDLSIHIYTSVYIPDYYILIYY